MANRRMKMRLFPRDLECEIKEIEAHCKCLRAEIEKARKEHRSLKKDNKLYSPIAYHTFQIAIHNDMIRSGLTVVEHQEPTILANGTELTWS